MNACSAAVDIWLEKLITGRETPTEGTPGRPDEYETKQLLQACGLAVPAGIRLTAGETADTVHKSVKAPLYVAKVCSAEILHKTDRGGVIMNLDAEALPEAIRGLRRRFPGADLLVEEQVSFTGPEFIIGALVDPSLGPALMVGAGGILTELYQDVAFRLVPCPPQECRRMLTELTLAPLLEGYRGLDLDSGALSEAVYKTGRLTMALGALFNQLDINPLVYSRGIWTVLDAKLLLQPGSSGRPIPSPPNSSNCPSGLDSR